MIRFLIKQYQFGCSVGFGRKYALIRAISIYRGGFR